MGDVDIYRIARLLVEEHGVFAADEVKQKIIHYNDVQDVSSTKIWYEIEDAVKEIQKSQARSVQDEPVN